MISFKYSAKNQSGQTITGTIAAKDRGQALEELRRKNLTILDVKALGDSKASKEKKVKKGKANRGVKRDEIVVFSRQLATMVTAGIPLLECLEILAEQAETPNFRATLEGVVEDVRSGKDLSKALERYPRVFVPLYINMVRAAEVSGQLDIILVRLAEYLEAAAALRREIKSAMTYPIISLFLVVGIASFLLIGIVPQFKPVFESLEVKMPAMTLIVMDSAFWFKDYWYIVFGSMVGMWFAFLAFKRTERGAFMMDSLVLKLPIFGQLFHKVALARFSRTFSTLIKSGVPILSAMEIVAETAGNRVISKAVLTAMDSVRQGETLSDPLAKSKAFPPMVTKMIGIGERSGALDALLEKIAVFYDQQVGAAVKSLTSMIEPLLITVMGVLVGTIVLAVFLPIFELQKKLAQG